MHGMETVRTEAGVVAAVQEAGGPGAGGAHRDVSQFPKGKGGVSL
jgi:hypothetical protein